MTDKQIIFKCDVDCIRKNTEECFELDCIKGQESILKQLQAKEQECDRLKEYLAEESKLAHKVVQEEVDTFFDLMKAKKQLDQLKAYNKQLEKENLHYRNQFAMQYMSITVDGKEVYCGPVKRLEKTLQEIKEIAENAYCLTNGINKDMANFAKQILQKISECEVQNENN